MNALLASMAFASMAFILPACLLVAAPVTVRDMIAMTQLVDPNPYGALGSTKFNGSPDAKHVAIVTRRGDIVSGQNTYALELLDLTEVRRYLNANNKAVFPKLDVLTTFESRSPRDAIEQVHWSYDSKSIFFIGRDDDGVGQLYSFSLGPRVLKRITRHDGNITTFSVARDSPVIVFSALQPPDWNLRNEFGYAIESEWVGTLALTDPKDSVQDVRHFILDQMTGVEREIDLGPSRYPQNIAISPSGAFAIVIVQVKGIPLNWRRYTFVEGELSKISRPYPKELASQSTEEEINHALGSLSGWLNRYMLVDTRTGKARALVDAPVRTRRSFARAVWSKKEDRIILAPTYLPLSSIDEAELERRRTTEVIAEANIQTGEIVEITELSRSQQLVDVAWDANDILRIKFAPPGSTHVTDTRWKRQKSGRWSRTADAQSSDNRIFLSVVQDVNTPYEIYAGSKLSNTELTRITEFNPALKNLELGTVERFEWTDRLGRSFRGGLLRPPGYRADRQYPVVIQTYGFDEEEFLFDGPHGLSSAYVARPLAGHGMLVLQLPDYPVTGSKGSKDPCTNWNDCGENPRFLAMLEGALDGLRALNLIDESRIGLIGFSREGMHVHYAITFSRYNFAAATICDSVASSPLGYALAYGFSVPGMTEWEAETAIGAPFWGSGVQQWIERSPIFYLDRISAALRLETIGKGIPAYWDVFAILKRMRRPVELIHIPQDFHNLNTPRGRYVSQQGNVDWFRFWLTGEQDSDQSKTAQYARWRKLMVSRKSD